MKWFKHDSNANMDAKLRRVRLKYGLEGYGLYWYCLELIAMNVENHHLTFDLEEDSELIAADTNIHQEVVEEMMCYMVDLGLFEQSGDYITCMKMLSRTDEYTQKLIRAQELSGIVSVPCPDKVPPIRLEENRLEENSKGNSPPPKSKKFIPPTVDQVQEYITEKGYTINAERFVDHYEANGWVRGKNKVKCWKACVRTWNRNDDQNTNSAGGDFVI